MGRRRIVSRPWEPPRYYEPPRREHLPFEEELKSAWRKVWDDLFRKVAAQGIAVRMHGDGTAPPEGQEPGRNDAPEEGLSMKEVD